MFQQQDLYGFHIAIIIFGNEQRVFLLNPNDRFNRRVMKNVNSLRTSQSLEDWTLETSGWIPFLFTKCPRKRTSLALY